MTAIRSQFLSLFSGGIFPDKKWWLSCFCLPRNKEEKTTRRPSPQSERAIYTIQTNEDEELPMESEFLSDHGKGSLLPEESQSGKLLAGEKSQKREHRMLTLDGLNLLTDHQGFKSLSETTEENNDHVLDKGLENSGVNENLTSLNCLPCNDFAAESSAVLSDKEPLSSQDVKVQDKEEPLTSTAGLKNAADDKDEAVSSGRIEKETLTEAPLAVSNGISSRSHPPCEVHEKQPDDTTENIRCGTMMLQRSDGICLGSGETDRSSSDPISKTSDLETSGIQSSVTYEDTTLHLNSSYDNSCESTDDSDANIQLTNSLPLSPQTNEESLSTAESGSFFGKEEVLGSSHGLKPERQSKTTFPSSTSSSSDLNFSASPEDSSFQENKSEFPLSPDNYEAVSCSNNAHVDVPQQKLFTGTTTTEMSKVLDDHTYCAAVHDDHINQNLDITSDCLDHNSRQSEFSAHDESSENTFANEALNITAAETNSCGQTTFSEVELQKHVAETDERINSSSLFSTADLPERNRETVVDGSDDVRSDISYAVEKGKQKADGRETASWITEDLVPGINTDPVSRLQVKLLFRSDSYETLERLVEEQTDALLVESLDRLLELRRTKMSRHPSNRFDQVIPRDAKAAAAADDVMWIDKQLLISRNREDPFVLPTPDIFEETLVDNYEQLFDNDEWLDDDFGFPYSIRGKPPPPYHDRLTAEQHQFSRIPLHLPDLDLEEDFLQPDLKLFVIHLNPESIFPLVDQATDVFWSSRRYGEPWSEVHPPKTYFTPEDYNSSLDDCSRRSHKIFLFDLVAEVLQDIFSDELTEEPDPWNQVNIFRPKAVVDPPTTVDLLKPLVQNRVMNSLRTGVQGMSEKTRRGIGKKSHLDRKDFVDTLLVTEMYHEEPGWTNYSNDANIIKNRIANKVFSSLIDDTVQALKFIHREDNLLSKNC